MGQSDPEKQSSLDDTSSSDEEEWRPNSASDEAHDATWNEMLHGLLDYKKDHGSFTVPRDYEYGGRLVHCWLMNLRQLFWNFGRGKTPVLVPRRLKLLRTANIPGFEDEPYLDKKQMNDSKWYDMLEPLVAFHAESGHWDVPLGAKTRDGRCLGDWVCLQRRSLLRMQLATERREKLESIGFDFGLGHSRRPGRARRIRDANQSVRLRLPVAKDAPVQGSGVQGFYYDVEELVSLDHTERGAAQSNHGLSNTAEPECSIFRATKKLPKYLGSELLLSDDDLETQVLPLYETHAVVASDHRSVAARLLPIPYDAVSLSLSFVGKQEALYSFLNFFGAWCTARIRRFNYDCLVQTGKRISVELDLSMPAGARVVECMNYSGSSGPVPNGLLLHIEPVGQLGSLIGIDCVDRGACVVGLGWLPCLSIARFKEILCGAGSGTVLLELAVESDADLSVVPHSCVDQQHKQQFNNTSSGGEPEDEGPRAT